MRCLVVVAVVAGTLFSVAPALAIECPESTVQQRIDRADASFVGRMVSSRAAGSGERFYRFTVNQTVKGPVGREIELRAQPLTDAKGRPLERDVAVGVFAKLEGATFTTDSCHLIDPGTLLAVADEPRGSAIKVVIGTVILAAVLLFSIQRLRRRGGGTASHPIR